MPPAARDALLEDLHGALAPGGLDLIAARPAAAYDRLGPPSHLRSAALLDGARSIIVVGSGGRALWPRFLDWLAEAPRARFADEAHPLDRYVASVLDRGDALLAARGVRARRLEPTFLFQPRVDFRLLAAACGLGCPSPLGLLVHPRFGPWWALRGAWVVDAAVATDEESDPLAPCAGCPAPCRAAIPDGAEGTLAAATIAARLACVLSAERYDDDQLEFHYRPDEARARLAARLGLS